MIQRLWGGVWFRRVARGKSFENLEIGVWQAPSGLALTINDLRGHTSNAKNVFRFRDIFHTVL